jgi:hypothetical protein
MQSQPTSPVRNPRPSWQRWLLIAAIVLAVAFSVFQLVGAARQLSRVVGHRQDSIAPWMTIGHVARLHRVPPDKLEQALGLEVGSAGRKPLGGIAREQHLSFEAFQTRVQAAIDKLGGIDPGPQPPGPPPPEPPPPPGAAP